MKSRLTVLPSSAAKVGPEGRPAQTRAGALGNPSRKTTALSAVMVLPRRRSTGKVQCAWDRFRLPVVIYSALGLHGWFVDGYLLNTPAALPLGPADNIFHLLLGLSALGVIAWAARVSTPAQP